jgi:oligopeptide/dipeptide ABC transporter ATP-binding protein
MQMIFQDPYASLNPRMTVRDLIAEPLETYGVCPTKQATTERVLELMRAVGVPEEFLLRYPHQFSGGQRQRIGIARAIALQPSLIVCDEPVSALDVSVQNQILNLLKGLQSRFGLTYLFISHDLSVVRFLSDRVCVMFLGTVCEIGETEEIYAEPFHPYTRFLLRAIPHPDPRRRQEDVQLLSGELPSPIDPPTGCRFHTRCPHCTQRCIDEVPALRTVRGRQVACHRCEELLPDGEEG